VASPFTLLGKLIGVEADELEYISFLHGRSDLTPPELERAAKLAAALTLRPELILEISGVVDSEADGLALRTARLDAVVEERIAELAPSDESEDMYAAQQMTVLEQMFVEQQAAEDTDLALEELRTRFTTQAAANDEDSSTPRFDELAYTNEIRRRLIELQHVTDTDLVALAIERAANAHDAIVANNENLQGRIIRGENKAVTRKSDELIRMKVTLSTNGTSKEKDGVGIPDPSQ
jgi:hypothetical protein